MSERVLNRELAFDVVASDCMGLLATLPNNSIDSLVTDPPAGIAFMNAEWDGSKGSRDKWIAWLTGVLRECYRAMKPGAHGLVWAIPRTSHWTATACEDAGFEIRDKHYHLFGSAMPKNHNVGLAIQTYKDTGRSDSSVTRSGARDRTDLHWSQFAKSKRKTQTHKTLTDVDAKTWEGSGTATKPACEEWIRIRKPLEGTVAENVLQHGTGVLNIDGCRIGSEIRSNIQKAPAQNLNALARPGGNDSPEAQSLGAYGVGAKQVSAGVKECVGRWPANVMLSHLPECKPLGSKKIKAITGTAAGRMAGKGSNTYGEYAGSVEAGRQTGFGDADGTETVQSWDCAPGCPVAELDRQIGTTSVTGKRSARSRSAVVEGTAWGNKNHESVEYTDSGAASRFFYVAKPSTAERDAGAEDLLFVRCKEGIGWRLATRDDHAAAPEQDRNNGNVHPTVKSVDLMRWLIRLITPPGGTVLDPFCGSGSTGCAAVAESFRFLGCEQAPEYAEIARRRIAWWQTHPGGPTPEAKTEAKLEAAGQLSLLGGK